MQCATGCGSADGGGGLLRTCPTSPFEKQYADPSVKPRGQTHVTSLLACGRQLGPKRNMVQHSRVAQLCTAAVAAGQALLCSQFHQRHVDGVFPDRLQLDDEGVLVAVVLDHVVIHSYSHPFLASLKYVLYT